MIKIFIPIILLVSQATNILAQSTYPVNTRQDIIHYTFSIRVNDTTNVITGEATILFSSQNQDKLVLDFIGLQRDGRGMVVKKISSGNIDLSFTHQDNRLTIDFDNQPKYPSEIKIWYHGIAANGLIIDNNKFGERVFFGDNYPDRARNWLPCVDHPADKATVTWNITAPTAYKVVANGKFVGKQEIDEDITTTTWDEKIPISTKVMVFGAANFVVDKSGNVDGVPVTTWVYQQNGKEGFHDFAIATEVLAYYDSLIAPYPYEKLANVQSKTRYGGMENASNIFYFENSVNGKGERENLIAHEIVHQWFGNSATEKDWPHAWLSEGFATYLTHVYVGARIGNKEMQMRLARDRDKVIGYWHQNPLPIVNLSLVTYPQIAGLKELLSANTYQKGGWVLHMLKNKLGDEIFWRAIRTYYNEYKNGIASTADFQSVAAQVSGKDLDIFFQQWLYGSGQPKLAGSWSFENDKLMIEINQEQDKPFVFPLEVGLVYKDDFVIKDLKISSKNEQFEFTLGRPDKIVFDPGIKLLYEGNDTLVEQHP